MTLILKSIADKKSKSPFGKTPFSSDIAKDSFIFAR